MRTGVIYKLVIPLLITVALIATNCGNNDDGQAPVPNSESAETATITPDVTCPETGDEWSVYDGKETGICFRYPSEWGEVIDYADYFKELLLAEREPEELSKEEDETMEAWESAIREAGQYLSFSNLDMDWGAHIRIASVEKMEAFISSAYEDYTSPEAEQERGMVWLVPLLGYFGGQFVMDPDYMEQLPQMIQDIANLPEDASPEELRDTALPVFFLFANGVRYTDLRFDDDAGTVIGVLGTTHSQIITADGKLSGVTEIGSEGFDVAGRNYWDCILTTSDGNHLVYITFSLQLPEYNAWDNPVEWSMGETPPGMEELLEEQQQTQFIEFVRTITLLE